MISGMNENIRENYWGGMPLAISTLYLLVFIALEIYNLIKVRKIKTGLVMPIVMFSNLTSRSVSYLQFFKLVIET